MKNNIVSTLVLLSMWNIGTAQTCSELKKGMKLNLEIKVYPMLMEKEGTKFFSMKQAEKEKKGEAYKNDIVSGKVSPSSVSQMVYTVSDFNANNEYELSTNIGGVEYKTYYACKNDSFYIVRSKGPQPIVYQGETLGIQTNGAQIIPFNLKVGGFTPGYIDETIISTNKNEKVLQNFSVGSGAYHYSGYVTANVNFSVASRTIKLYQGGNVNREEMVKISGKDYKSFVVGTEIWAKTNNSINADVERKNYFSDPINGKINNQIQKNYDKGGKKLAAKLDAASGANDQGYVVSYKEEWIVPGLGVVKTVNYDPWGCILNEVVLKSID